MILINKEKLLFSYLINLTTKVLYESKTEYRHQNR